MLAGMALKRRWAARTGNDLTRKPNLVMGANVQVCWEKFCRYWDVEPRIVPMDGDRFHLDAATAAAAVDETPSVWWRSSGRRSTAPTSRSPRSARRWTRSPRAVGLMFRCMSTVLPAAMIAPFLDPDLVWDFQLPRVSSINTSGHKYGLVYPGVGWVLWRDKAHLPEELVFNVNYLGGNMPTFALNFSRPGFGGGRAVLHVLPAWPLRVIARCSRRAATSRCSWRQAVEELGPFTLISRGDQLPVFAFTTKPDVKGWDVFGVSRLLRERGWQVPAYTFPENREDLAVLRVVCRNGFSQDLADDFLDDLQRSVDELQSADHVTISGPSGFHH